MKDCINYKINKERINLLYKLIDLNPNSDEYKDIKNKLEKYDTNHGIVKENDLDVDGINM